jgi:hypothetical protein
VTDEKDELDKQLPAIWIRNGIVVNLRKLDRNLAIRVLNRLAAITSGL